MEKVKWLIPCNIKKYDIFGAFEKDEILDWHISKPLKNIKVDDIIYIYCGVPYKKIMFKCQVLKRIGKESKYKRKDDEFNLGAINVDEGYEKYVKIKLINRYETKKLSLDNLIRFGLKVAPRGPLRITEKLKLQDYIESVENNEL